MGPFRMQLPVRLAALCPYVSPADVIHRLFHQGIARRIHPEQVPQLVCSRMGVKCTSAGSGGLLVCCGLLLFLDSPSNQLPLHNRQYFEPIEEGMPKNCSKDVAAAITAIDKILLKGSKDEKHKLKETFGLENLEDDGDFGRYVWDRTAHSSEPFSRSPSSTSLVD